MSDEIFISSKTLDGDGIATRDSEIAREVYNHLTSAGHKVFLSTISLESTGSSAYKRAIDEALDRAAVLIAVGTSSDNLESRWVRYEWDSFFNDVLSGVKPDGRVFTYVENVDTRELPRALRQTQTFAHSPDSLRRLRNFIGRSVSERADEKKSIPDASKIQADSPKVFISATSEDRDVVESLATIMEGAGFNVMQVDHVLQPGDDWSQEIGVMIRQCTFFIPIISQHTESTKEGFFRREWLLASERSMGMAFDRPFIFPIILGDVGIPRYIPPTFQKIQWTRLTDDVPADFVAILTHHAHRLRHI